MGDLIRIPHSELNATVEVLDHQGVAQHDFEVLRKASSWSKSIVGRIFKTDPFLWAMLEMEGVAQKAGFMDNDFRALAKDEDKLRQILSVVRGFSEIKPIECLVDCDADPFMPSGWSVEEHKKNGKLKLEMQGADLYLGEKKIVLYLSKKQRKGVIGGNELRKELDDKPALNANVLDYLLANPHLIPEEWKGKVVFFWGTIYRGSVGGLCVRCLCFFGGGGWRSRCRWLDYDWHDNCPAALRAS